MREGWENERATPEHSTNIYTRGQQQRKNKTKKEELA